MSVSGSSIVGTWNTFVDWGCTGTAKKAYPLTFDDNGTWTYAYGGGWWVQVEGMFFFSIDNTPTLIYTANVTKDGVVGIMGFASAVRHDTAGCWRGTRPGAPQAAVTQAKEGHDILLGPEKDS